MINLPLKKLMCDVDLEDKKRIIKTKYGEIVLDKNSGYAEISKDCFVVFSKDELENIFQVKKAVDEKDNKK